MYNYLGEVLTVDKSFIPYSPEYLDDSGNPKWSAVRS